MRWDAWRFSAKLAWQDPFVRWASISVVLFCTSISAFVLWKLIPIGLRSGVLTFHYNIYLGIDDVRSWPWIFVPLAAMLVAFLLDIGLALGLYRKDMLAARAIVGLSLALCILWGAGLFFLTLVNL